VSWEIRANLGPHVRPGSDARGWLWELTRDGEATQVVVEVSEAAWSTDPPRLPEDTRQALETDGRAALLDVLGEERPPGVIRCGTDGCTRERS